MTPVPLFFPWLLGTVIIVFLLWLAWQRPSRKRLLWRMAASIMAGLSLVFLIFPPTFERTLDAGSAILLTAGYTQDTLTSLLSNSKAVPLVFSYKADAPDVVPVPNLYTLLQEHPALQTIHLLGHGLEAPELEVLKNIDIKFHIPPQPTGITHLAWSPATTLGHAIEVSGQYNAPAAEETKLYLLAAGSLQDSVLLKQKGSASFKLSFTPKQDGRFVYQLISKSEIQTDTLGQVPVQVLPAEKLRVLLVSAAPLFEFNFLKNHLGKLQHQVALRSTVSKGITRKEWINMPQTNLNQITAGLLKAFDVVITEPQALQELSQSERAALQQAVLQDGLGVLTIRTEQQPARSTAYFTDFSTKRVVQQDSRVASVSWGKSTQATITAIPYTIVNERTLTGLIQEKDKGLLAASKKEGWGTIAISLIPQTFSWKLEGKDKVYSSYWAHMLSELAKKEEQDKFWQLATPQAAKPGKPVQLVYTDYTSSNGFQELPEAVIRSIADTTGTKLAMQQNPHLPEQFTATYWPNQKGWHTINMIGSPDFHFFVQDSTAWSYEAIQARRIATRTFTTQRGTTERIQNLISTRVEMPLFWFFILFVISSGFLWLEEKL